MSALKPAYVPIIELRSGDPRAKSMTRFSFLQRGRGNVRGLWPGAGDARSRKGDGDDQRASRRADPGMGAQRRKDQRVIAWLLALFGKPKRKRLDLRCVSWAEGDRMLREGWTLAPEEDQNRVRGMVWLERLENL